MFVGDSSDCFQQQFKFNNNYTIENNNIPTMDSESEEKRIKDKTDISSQRAQVPSSTNFIDDLPRSLEADRLKYVSKEGNYFGQLYNNPVQTTLCGFSKVAQFAKYPYEQLIHNVDDYLKQAGENQRRFERAGDNSIIKLNQNSQSVTPGSAVVQEMDTFVASSQINRSTSSSIVLHQSSPVQQFKRDEVDDLSPIPTLPTIECSAKRGRLKPLTIEEYENDLRQAATDVELIERVFYGGMSCNQLRAALWPYLFGLITHRGKFERIQSSEGKEAHLFIEHEGNMPKWKELQKLYYSYQAQWKAILPDQELRFAAYRERKSLIERDVIRCDRLHPFYAEEPNHLAVLTNLLMTYMMYDFDIGYVQGMSDLAGPILYMYQGDLVKSFWIFVEVMKLFRRNFELTQKTIHFQLNCLYELIKNTDQKFADYLKEHESDNCFFAFRAIVCQFKRELMKEDEDDYSKVLFLWDTIWSVQRRCSMLEELKELSEDNQMLDEAKSGGTKPSKGPITSQPICNNDNPFFLSSDPNQSDTPRHNLTETEIYVLALCLSMVRRERDLIMARKLDSTDIHLHFIDPKLSSDLDSFIEHAINIYSFLKNDFDLTKVTSPKAPSPVTDSESLADGYDSMNDFLIINGASGT